MKSLKPSYANLKKLQIIMYEFTGMAGYLHMFDAGFSNVNFFCAFYSLKKEIETKVNNGETFKYNFVRLDGSKVPFSYNSI